MKVSPHYDIRELVPPETYNKWGGKSTWFVPQKVIDILELLHEKIEEEFNLPSNEVYVVVNNWHFARSGHIYKYSGYRPQTAYINDTILKRNPRSESFHRQGAADVKCYILIEGKRKKLTTAKVHGIINKYSAEFMAAGLTTLENQTATRSWTHFDCRNTGSDSILIVNP